MIRSVVIAESAQNQLRKLPRYVAEKLADWALAVEAYGLEEIRKVPGYHDEPFKGSELASARFASVAKQRAINAQQSSPLRRPTPSRRSN